MAGGKFVSILLFLFMHVHSRARFFLFVLQGGLCKVLNEIAQNKEVMNTRRPHFFHAQFTSLPRRSYFSLTSHLSSFYQHSDDLRVVPEGGRAPGTRPPAAAAPRQRSAPRQESLLRLPVTVSRTSAGLQESSGPVRSACKCRADDRDSLPPSPPSDW